jgi:bacteriocin-like protein
MSNLPSKQPEASACEALSDDELQAVSGGVALVVGRAALGGALVTGKIANGSLGGIKPFNCGACVQGIPFNLVNNPAVNPVLNAPLGRF